MADSKIQTFTIKSESRFLKPLRDDLSRWLDATGAFSEKTRESLLVAMGEACTNAMRHSYCGEPGHDILITAENQNDRVVFKIRDYGEKVDLARIKEKETPQLPPQQGGGLGIYFMKTIMDGMQYNTAHNQGNELILMKLKEHGGSA